MIRRVLTSQTSCLNTFTAGTFSVRPRLSAISICVKLPRRNKTSIKCYQHLCLSYQNENYVRLSGITPKMATVARTVGKPSRGTLTNPKLEEAFQAHGQSGHRFDRKTFTRPTYCHHCTDLLWGLTNQGLICEGECFGKYRQVPERCERNLHDTVGCTHNDILQLHVEFACYHCRTWNILKIKC